MPLVIGAPFGNRIRDRNATSTLGTYTRERRAGALLRWWRVLSTVRYYPRIGAWSNKLGLPNPGIDALSGLTCSRLVDASKDIVSVSARCTADWTHLIGACYYLVRPGYIELNVSCPNVGEADSSDYAEVFREAAVKFPRRAIVKLPPVGYWRMMSLAFCSGIVGFHCCNTLPTPGGGISGAPLKQLSLEAVRQVAEFRPRILIGGGGVLSRADADDYFAAGATSVSVASVLFWPWRRGWMRKLAADLRANGPLRGSTSDDPRALTGSPTVSRVDRSTQDRG